MSRIESSDHVVYIYTETDEDGEDKWHFDIYHPIDCTSECLVKAEEDARGGSDMFDELGPGFYRFTVWLEVYRDWEGITEADGGVTISGRGQ